MFYNQFRTNIITTSLNDPRAETQPESQSIHSNIYDEAPQNESQFAQSDKSNLNYTTLPSESTYTEQVIETSNPNYTAREQSYRPATQPGPIRLSAININLADGEIQNQIYISTNDKKEVSNQIKEVQNQIYASNQYNEVKNETYQAVEQCEQNELANPIYADGNDEQKTEMANPVYQS